MSNPINHFPCHVCLDGEAVEIPAFSTFKRVTSDCKPWPDGGTLGVCQACASVVKRIDPTWQSETDAIYQAYDIFHQADGHEQLVYSADQGAARFRSDPLVEKLSDLIGPAQTGSLLDVGCGKGAFLRAWAQAFPLWDLEGSDLGDSTAEAVRSIPGVRAMHTKGFEGIESTFDVVSMVHVLEHIVDPAAFLLEATDRLQANGKLFVEVPLFAERAFDLLVADHCSHFTSRTLAGLSHRAGLKTLSVSGEWNDKEVSGVFSLADARRPVELAHETYEGSRAAVERCLRWLEATLSLATQMQRKREFGIFGTSIGATWLAGSLERDIDFFVDEDPTRQGREHMGVPVLHPADVPSQANVFMCLPQPQAQVVGGRLLEQTGHWQPLIPPAFTS